MWFFEIHWWICQTFFGGEGPLWLYNLHEYFGWLPQPG